MLVPIYTRHPDALKGDFLYSARKAKQLGLSKTERGYLDNCVFFRPLCPFVIDGKDIVLRTWVDPHTTYVYDQEFHVRERTTKGDPYMKLSEYLDMVEELKKQDHNTTYIYWRCLYEPEIHSLPYKSQHLLHSHYIFSSSSVGRVIHEIRVFKDCIPFSELQVVDDAPRV